MLVVYFNVSEHLLLKGAKCPQIGLEGRCQQGAVLDGQSYCEYQRRGALPRPSSYLPNVSTVVDSMCPSSHSRSNHVGFSLLLLNNFPAWSV